MCSCLTLLMVVKGQDNDGCRDDQKYFLIEADFEIFLLFLWLFFDD